jgi:hypothetical protein
VRPDAGAFGNAAGRRRYDGPHRSQEVRSSSEMGFERNFSRADITFIFCISFWLSLPSFGPLPEPSTNSKSMSSHRPRKSLNPACKSGCLPRISYTSACSSILEITSLLKMFRHLISSLYALRSFRRAFTFSKNASSFARLAAVCFSSGSGGGANASPLPLRLFAPMPPLPRPGRRAPFLPAAGVEKSGRKYVNSSSRSLCDLNNKATSSYTCEMDFRFLRYMLRISRNALYTLSSLEKRVLILFTYEMACTNSTCGLGAAPPAPFWRSASSRSSRSTSSTRISWP